MSRFWLQFIWKQSLYKLFTPTMDKFLSSGFDDTNYKTREESGVECCSSPAYLLVDSGRELTHNMKRKWGRDPSLFSIHEYKPLSIDCAFGLDIATGDPTSLFIVHSGTKTTGKPITTHCRSGPPKINFNVPSIE